MMLMSSKYSDPDVIPSLLIFKYESVKKKTGNSQLSHLYNKDSS